MTVELYWATNCWDGLLSGVVRYPCGTLAWAECIDETDDAERRRTYAVYALSPAQQSFVVALKADWQRALKAYAADGGMWHLHGHGALFAHGPLLEIVDEGEIEAETK